VFGKNKRDGYDRFDTRIAVLIAYNRVSMTVHPYYHWQRSHFVVET
jgi:hypothetical protein